MPPGAIVGGVKVGGGMKQGGTPGAYGGTHGWGKHCCPFHPDGWLNGQTGIGSAYAIGAQPSINAVPIRAIAAFWRTKSILLA
ncbi:hypothetical protein DE4585_03006 [Mycobacteroides salmoniphilum]|uniref:Uncharacterized protein n=1 Tax=Mycobacteroides salmoniphilum TaxID=404941 RepID=A0A4R8RXG6_9MYCO|nr:hypothetical protein DE4585_03006 [Mycobacteroides salmoniphilum]TDZ81343.1 hypothetical protein DE4586_01290 [Mycobacteroides salmoniphilum]TDZ88843.1 hypothetical protein DE4587_01206 [Mycobacteroides salmoniphilum]